MKSKRGGFRYFRSRKCKRLLKQLVAGNHEYKGQDARALYVEKCSDMPSWLHTYKNAEEIEKLRQERQKPFTIRVQRPMFKIISQKSRKSKKSKKSKTPLGPPLGPPSGPPLAPLSGPPPLENKSKSTPIENPPRANSTSIRSHHSSRSHHSRQSHSNAPSEQNFQKWKEESNWSYYVSSSKALPEWIHKDMHNFFKDGDNESVQIQVDGRPAMLKVLSGEKYILNVDGQEIEFNEKGETINAAWNPEQLQQILNDYWESQIQYVVGTKLIPIDFKRNGIHHLAYFDAGQFLGICYHHSSNLETLEAEYSNLKSKNVAH